MLSYRLVLYNVLKVFFYLRHFKLDFFTLHYIALQGDSFTRKRFRGERQLVLASSTVGCL